MNHTLLKMSAELLAEALDNDYDGEENQCQAYEFLTQGIVTQNLNRGEIEPINWFSFYYCMEVDRRHCNISQEEYARYMTTTEMAAKFAEHEDWLGNRDADAFPWKYAQESIDALPTTEDRKAWRLALYATIEAFTASNITNIVKGPNIKKVNPDA